MLKQSSSMEQLVLAPLQTGLPSARNSMKNALKLNSEQIVLLLLEAPFAKSAIPETI